RPPSGVGRRLAAAERGLVHDVVVDQRGGVQQLHDAAEPSGPPRRPARQPRAQEDEDGPEPLAAGQGHVLRELADQGDGGPGQLPLDLRLAGAELITDRTPQSLPDGLLEGEAHRGGSTVERGSGLIMAARPTQGVERLPESPDRLMMRLSPGLVSWKIRSFHPRTTDSGPDRMVARR